MVIYYIEHMRLKLLWGQDLTNRARKANGIQYVLYVLHAYHDLYVGKN
jgi:hypothetical protein